MKKILGLILCFTMLFSISSGLVIASEDSSESVVYGENELGIFKSLGICEYTPENLSEKITRAEFIKLAAIVGGYPEYKSSEVVFSDLPLEHPFEPYVKSLYKLGIIAGADGKVNPDGEMTLVEASAVVLRLAGYGAVAEGKGGYPVGYINLARNPYLPPIHYRI